MAPLSKGWRGREKEGEEEREGEGTECFPLLGAGVADDVIFIPHKVLGLRSLAVLLERERGKEREKEKEKGTRERERGGREKPKGIKAKAPFVRRGDGPQTDVIMGSLRSSIASTACGAKYTLALSECGDVFAWGNGPVGVTGVTQNPLYCEFPTPIAMHFKGAVTQICTAAQCCVALTQVQGM